MSSPARSTRSSRASTPGSDSNATATFLSPRSKIQAMLAEIDADSDDELESRSAGPTLKPSRSIDLVEDKRESAASDSEDKEDEPVTRPRGRLAARMGTSNGPFQEDEASSEEEEHGVNVYQRIRQEMLAEKTQQAANSHLIEQPIQRTVTPSPPRRRLAARTQQLARSPSASTRSESPGLFMSPAPAREGSIGIQDNSDSDSDLPDSGKMQARLRELVERRRRDRLAKEAEERDAEEERMEHAGEAPLSDLFNDDEDVDLLAENRLTQQARPTRKASKKALEEMNRETQRMSRNMQLTHLAKTKKKFTTADFLSRFGASTKSQTPLANVTNAVDSSSVAGADSDVERAAPQDTPPSSPPSVHDEQEKLSQELPVGGLMDTTIDSAQLGDEDLPDLVQLTSSQDHAQAKTSNAAPPPPQSPKQNEHKKTSAKKLSPRKYRIIPPPRPTQDSAAQDDSDSDIEIVQGDRVSSIFASVGPSKAAESRPLHVLRHLAHLNHSEKPRLKKGEKPSMTPAQLEIELRRRARIQALQEREEKIANLRARGIIVLTEEEREKEQIFIENMLERAREEAHELRKKEMKAAKDAGLEEVDMLPSSDESDDGDFVGSGEENEGEGAPEDEDVDMSGSEEEEEQEGEAETSALVDNEAGEDEVDENDEEEELGKEPDDDQTAMEPAQLDTPTQAPSRKARIKRVVEDDDDDEEAAPTSSRPAFTTKDDMINDDLAAAFGFGAAPAMGVSQMFAGTMADTQDSVGSTVPGNTYPDPEQDSFAMLRHIPSAPMPSFSPLPESQDSLLNLVVADSQNGKETQGIDLHSSQLPLQETPSLQRIASASQFGDIDFTPSQDVGMRADQTPLKLDFKAPYSTQETVLMDVPESPVVEQVQRRGRLIRRAAPLVDDSEDEVVSATPDPTNGNNAFEAMRKASSKAERKAKQAEFNKKASEARRMVEEQAEESEDEYAGLGGASDDEALADLDVADEADKAMIDESDVAVNERELAAFYAEKARNADEAQTSKLYRDLMSGAMRRGRGGAGGAFDLDSDEDEQVAERRRRRQREEARKRRLLLQDESVGKLGTNEKKEAFLRAIEDRDSDDDMGDLLDGHDVDEDAALTDSQEIAQDGERESTSQLLQETSANVLKRKTPSASQDPTAAATIASKRPKISMRRNPLEAFRAPRSLQEVRDSVSFLIEDAHIDPEANGTMFSDDEDADDEYSYNSAAATRAPATERRTQARPGVVDRLTLKKQTSSMLSGTGAAATGDGNMAFTKQTPVFASSFSRVPALLRRATTNLSTTSSTGSTTFMPPPPRRAAVGREDSTSSTGGGVRMGGSKKSSINYQAREAERRIVLERAERKRKEEVRKIAGLRRGSGAQGAGVGGLKGVLGASSGFE